MLATAFGFSVDPPARWPLCLVAGLPPALLALAGNFGCGFHVGAHLAPPQRHRESRELATW